LDKNENEVINQMKKNGEQIELDDNHQNRVVCTEADIGSVKNER